MEKLIEKNFKIIEHLIENENWEQAEILLIGILNVKPNSQKAYQLYGMVLYLQKRYQEAIKVALKAIELDKTNLENYSNLNLCYLQLRQINKSIEILLKGLEIEPDNLGFNIDLSFAYFLNAEWAKGWALDEYRIKFLKKIKAFAKFYELFNDEKRWNGIDSLEDKKIIVYCEQGIGDFIQLIRFVPRLKELGAEVYIFTQENLVSLFEGYGNVLTAPINYDFNCSVMSLPYILNITQLDGKSYITADKFDLSKYKDNFKIGITWTGNPAHYRNQIRSCQLSNFKNIANMPNIKLFSLQKDVSVEGINIIDMSEYMTDFKETAKIIQAMDLIITVDTSVLHLAGALGKETWALIPFIPCGRWTLDGDKTVWYDSVTVFRQEEEANWDLVFAKVENKLKDN